MNHDLIDLRSDTATRPSKPMLEAMMRAEVGDEQQGEDPTVNRLCDMLCERLGKEAALFLPSGTMANQIAMLLHCRPGDEILAADSVHIGYSEGGGAAALAGAQLKLLPHIRGVIDPDTIRNAIRPDRPQSVRSRLLVLEQTCNRSGGSILPLQDVRNMAAVAREAGLAIHIDGARIFNAEIGSSTEAAAFAAETETVFVDLTKGLGCPFGALLVGSRTMIEEGLRHKMRLGGGMRQAGIMAAAGIYALEHNISRLSMDHAVARELAKGLAKATGLTVAADQIETNIINVCTKATRIDAKAFAERLLNRNVRVKTIDRHTLRLVTHLDFDPGLVPVVVEHCATVSEVADSRQAV